MCTATALIILLSGVLGNGSSGIELLLEGFATYYSPAISNAIISIAIVAFCLSTQIGFFVYFETALVDLIGGKKFNVIKWVYFLPGVMFAGITDVDKLWMLANISVAVSAIPNLIALLFLSKVFLTLIRDYMTGINKYSTKLIDETRQYIRIA